jgi:hypothetical protein
MTEWRPIPSNPKYLASSDGEIRHRDSDKPRRLQRRSKGYATVGFWQNRKLRVRLVHVLVAEAFHGPMPEGEETRHLDGDPGNNRPGNLKYGTKKENMADRELHGRTRRGQHNGNARLADDDADFIRLGYAAKLFNQYELAAMFGISQAQVNNIVLDKQRVQKVA